MCVCATGESSYRPFVVYVTKIQTGGGGGCARKIDFETAVFVRRGIERASEKRASILRLRPAGRGSKAGLRQQSDQLDIGCSGGIKLRGGNDLLGSGCAAPTQLRQRATVSFEVFHFDCVVLAGDQIDRARPLGGGLGRPVIDQKFVVDPETHAIVSSGVEGVALGFLGDDLAVPTNGEGIGSDAGHGRAGAPVEIHVVVDAAVYEAGEIRVVVISAEQAIAGLGVVDDFEPV